MKRKASMRLGYENQAGLPVGAAAAPEAWAVAHYSYYQCAKCEQPYYGGLARCEAAGEGGGGGEEEGGGGAGAAPFRREDLVCTSCLPFSAEADCSTHGKEYIVYKCRFCCNG